MFQGMQKHLGRYRLTVVCTVSGMILLMALLVACGSGGTTTGGQGQPSPTTSTQVQDCGKVDTFPTGLPADASKAQQNENCFWQAFQKCQSAKLTFTKRGIDAGTTHTFTIEKQNSQCSISDATQHYIAPSPPQQGKTYTCMGLTQRSDGLHFTTCGDEGDIIVPAK